MSSSKPQRIALANILRIIRFQAKDVGDLLNLREIDDDHAELIDGDHVLDLWTKFITAAYIEKAFASGRVYIVERALRASEWYNEGNNKFNPIFRDDSNAFLVPDVAKYVYELPFVQNTFPEIDVLIVRFGFIDRVATMGNGSYTPLLWSCYKGNYPRATFFLNNGADTEDGSFEILLSWANNVESGELKNPDFRRLVKLFVERGVSSESIAVAIMQVANNFDFIKFLIGLKKVNLNVIDEDTGLTLLENVIEDAPIEVIKLLLDNGADVNFDNRGNILVNRISGLKTNFRPDVIVLLGQYGLIMEPKVDGKDLDIDETFNMAEFLRRAGNEVRIDKNFDLTDVHRVLRMMLASNDTREHDDHMFDLSEIFNVFVVAPDLESLKILVDYMDRKPSSKHYRDLLVAHDHNDVGIMAHLYSNKLFDCIEFLFNYRLENTRVPIGGIFRIIDYDVPSYADIRRKVDNMMAPYVPDGSLLPTAPVRKLVQWFTDSNLSTDYYEYILNTKDDSELEDFYGSIALAPKPGTVFKRRETIQKIIRKRRDEHD